MDSCFSRKASAGRLDPSFSVGNGCVFGKQLQAVFRLCRKSNMPEEKLIAWKWDYLKWKSEVIKFPPQQQDKQEFAISVISMSFTHLWLMTAK